MKTKLLKRYRKLANDSYWIGKNIGLGKQPYIIYNRIEEWYGESLLSIKNIELARVQTKEEAEKLVVELKREYIINLVREHYPEGAKKV